MSVVYRFLATYEGLIYILLALGGLFSFRWLWKSWNEWRDSVFGLEREFAMRRLSQALMVSLLILFAFFGELILASFVIPTLPSTDMLVTATLDILDQPEGAQLSPLGDAVTSIPDSTSGLEGGCIPGKLILTSPESGQEVSGTITLVGTVNVDNFGFYKYEFSPLDAGVWATISAGREAVENGELGLWDTSTLTPGDYQLSLEVTDNQGLLFPPCVVTVRVVAP
jgi:hypothetical protein